MKYILFLLLCSCSIPHKLQEINCRKPIPDPRYIIVQNISTHKYCLVWIDGISSFPLEEEDGTVSFSYFNNDNVWYSDTCSLKEEMFQHWKQVTDAKAQSLYKKYL